MTHKCVGNVTIIGPDNGLSPGRRQAIIWTNAWVLLIGPLGTIFSEILIEFHTFSFKKMHLKKPSGNERPFCLGLNVLNKYLYQHLVCNDFIAIFYVDELLKRWWSMVYTVLLWFRKPCYWECSVFLRRFFIVDVVLIYWNLWHICAYRSEMSSPVSWKITRLKLTVITFVLFHYCLRYHILTTYEPANKQTLRGT